MGILKILLSGAWQLTAMILVPPISVFIDFSGTPLFEPREDPQAYVAAAVAIALTDHSNALALLPRENDGSLMKSSSKNFNDFIAAEFFSKLLSLNASVAFVGIDASDAKNCEWAERSLRRRNRNYEDKMKIQNWMYLLTAKEVISTIWQCSPIDGGQIDSFEAVFDEDSLPPREKEIFESIVKSSFQRKGRGSSVRSISWKSRYREPMLFVPDIAAGVFSRWSRRQDVSKVHDEILKGEAQGKVLIVNGFSLLDLED
jgi:hypothetical protein